MIRYLTHEHYIITERIYFYVSGNSGRFLCPYPIRTVRASFPVNDHSASSQANVTTDRYLPIATIMITFICSVNIYDNSDVVAVGYRDYLFLFLEWNYFSTQLCCYNCLP